MYLLDTNIVSELRRVRPHGAVVQWINAIKDTDLKLSAMTIGQIQTGIEATRAQDAPKALELSRWLQEVIAGYDVLAADAAVFRIWGRLMHRQPDTLIEDAIIAATAQVHGLTVVTRNTRDFAMLDVPCLNPFEPVAP